MTDHIVNLKVEGRAFEWILGSIGIVNHGGYSSREQCKCYKTYDTANGIITNLLGNTLGLLTIYDYWDYRLTVKKNLFVIVICDKYETYNYVKILTNEEQRKVRKVLGYNEEVSAKCDCDDDDDEYDDDEDEDPKTKPCSCGCEVIGGSCEKGVAIDNGEYDDDEEETNSNLY
jgi:hypothetical protein